jgi:putative DNA primase/helicase
MSLADIVKTLGGELCGHGGRRALIPGPGHSPDDRSVSLMVDPSGRLVVQSFGRSAWYEVLDALRERHFIDDNNYLCGSGQQADYTVADRTDVQKVAVARRLWARGRPAAGTLSERYIRGRAINRPLPSDEVVRHLAATPVRAYDDEAPYHPAMLACVRNLAGEVTAVEITYLDRFGSRHPRLKTPRKIIGVIPEGAAVRIDAADEEMAVAEGFFSALSASERFGRPAWALLSTSRMRVWTPPAGTRSVLIAADNGRAGAWAAGQLTVSLQRGGVEAFTRFPAPRFDDFNSEAQWAARPTMPAEN